MYQHRIKIHFFMTIVKEDVTEELDEKTMPEKLKNSEN